MDAIASRLENAKLAAAIDNACDKLPDGCVVRIDLSREAGVVTLEIDGHEEDFASNRETLSETINDAVAHALNGAE